MPLRTVSAPLGPNPCMGACSPAPEVALRRGAGLGIPQRRCEIRGRGNSRVRGVAALGVMAIEPERQQGVLLALLRNPGSWQANCCHDPGFRSASVDRTATTLKTATRGRGRARRTSRPGVTAPRKRNLRFPLAPGFGICILFSCANAYTTFPGGAVVAQLTVNQRVVGSNPTRGASTCEGRQTMPALFLWLC